MTVRISLAVTLSWNSEVLIFGSLNFFIPPGHKSSMAIQFNKKIQVLPLLYRIGLLHLNSSVKFHRKRFFYKTLPVKYQSVYT